MSDIDLTLPAYLDRTGLPGMVDRAASSLAGARNAAEVLEARELAGVAYDAAKRAARLSKAKGAHDELIAKIHRAQADALEIEAAAKRRLADEYDAAQERGEISEQGAHVSGGNMSTADLGISRKEIHEARQIRDAESAAPGLVKATLSEVIEAGEEPTRAKLRRAVTRTLDRPEPAPRPKQGRAAIIARVNSAIAMLTGLPSAAEVISYLGGTDEAVLIGEHLPAAMRWLSEFSEMWPDEATNAEAAE